AQGDGEGRNGRGDRRAQDQHTGRLQHETALLVAAPGLLPDRDAVHRMFVRCGGGPIGRALFPRVRYGTLRPRLWMLLVLLGGCAGPIEPDVVHVREARRLVADSRTPPAADRPGWQTRTLPDIWSAARRRDATSGWYRATIDLPAAPARLWAVYL